MHATWRCCTAPSAQHTSAACEVRAGHLEADQMVCAMQDGTFADQVYRPLRKNEAGDACVFLDGRRCSVYNSRPAQVAAALASSGTAHLTSSDQAPHCSKCRLACSAARTRSGRSTYRAHMTGKRRQRAARASPPRPRQDVPRRLVRPGLAAPGHGNALPLAASWVRAAPNIHVFISALQPFRYGVHRRMECCTSHAPCM